MKPGIWRPQRAKGRAVGNIGKEAQEIEVLPAEQAAPAEQVAPAERESRPAEPAPPDPAPVPAEPTPARA